MKRSRNRRLLDELRELLSPFVGETLVSEGPTDTLSRFLTELLQHRNKYEIDATVPTAPIPLLLWCPACGERHLDVGEWQTRVHHTHACQSCGMVWRPAVPPTVGVAHLPGFKNAT